MHTDFTMSEELLANPGMGWQTFHHFADEDPALDGLPSTVAYFRYYWSQLEPADGEVRFELIDDHLAKAHAAGQKLAFRVMCCSTGDTPGCPKWLRDVGCPGFEYTYGRRKTWPKKAKTPDVPYHDAPNHAPPDWHWSPEMDSAMFQKEHFRFIAELGARYDGHPDLDLVDVGTVGLWGEWHMSGTGYQIPSPETCRRVNDAWRRAFPSQPMVYLIGDTEGMKRCAEHGVGWRADCLGDMGGFSDTWNHMEHCYRQRIAEAGAEDAWKTAPVAWESCWDVRKWVNEGWDVCHIFKYGLDLHGSYLNNKSAAVPPEARPEIEEFLKRLGYRLAIRSIEYPESAKAGETVPIKMEWENVGVAPPYRDHVLAFRLRGSGGERIVRTDMSVRGWLPGRRDEAVQLALPGDIAPGEYDVHLALVDPNTREPAIRLAVDEAEDDGWYAVGSLSLEV